MAAGTYHTMGTGALVLLAAVIALSVVKGDEEYMDVRPLGIRSRRAVSPNAALLEVTTTISPPYLMAKTSEGGEVYYEGFIQDLLDAITARTSLRFQLHLVADGKFGSEDANSDVGWNGMIGEVVRKEKSPTSTEAKADMAASPMTMTSARQGVVNFINPFQHIGLTLLTKKPVQEDNIILGHFVSSFRVLAPLDVGVWLLCIVAFFVVSGLLWTINKLNPYEWRGRYNLGRATEEQADTFNMAGALWFTFTTLQWQGFDRAPRSIGARVLAGFWFVFVTLTLITYTGALINNLFWASTVHGNSGPRGLPYRNLEELLLLPDYKVGILAGGSSYTYITKYAKTAEYQHIKSYFLSGAGVDNMVTSYEDALVRIRADDKYAFIMESAHAEYYTTQSPCDLTTVGGIFTKRSYGMPVRKDLDADVVDALHSAILELTELGDIEAMEERWFKQGECWNVTRLEKIQSQNGLLLNKPRTVDLGMFWGPMVILAAGILLSLLAMLAEVLFFKYKGRYLTRNMAGGQKLALDEDNSM